MTMTASVAHLLSGEVRGTLPPARLAFRFEPATVRAMLPRNVVGTYLLLHDRTPVYVGRSDTCLRERLATHNHIGRATHVVWEPTGTIEKAFHLEAYWYHRHQHTLLNLVHPASPGNTGSTCPFCTAEGHALSRALGRTPAGLTNLDIQIDLERNHAS